MSVRSSWLPDRLAHSIATFLQRVGARTITAPASPRNISTRRTRDELVECAAAAAVRRAA